jgi:hypothetical protein
MAKLSRRTARSRIGALLIIGAAITAPAIMLAGPADAALSGTGWSAATLPANFDLVNAAPLAPASCVHGAKFCVVVAGNDAVVGPNGIIGQGDLVTTDGGTDWTGYTDLPSASMTVTAISCPTRKVCWASGPGPEDQPEVARSGDGGKTWTLATPAAWASASYSWWPNAISCVSASTCWLAGQTANSTQNPEVAETTDGGGTWTTFSNLPAVTPDSNGDTYGLNGISCVAADSCVAVGGINGGSGPATVISTTNGGTSWSLSTASALGSVEDFFSVSCLPGPSVTSGAICRAAGVALEAAGPVELSSSDGGNTWGGLETFGDTGWLNSISCADAEHCWAASSGTTVALAGTDDGGASWSTVTSDTSNEDGSVSCATAKFCVATTDGELWVTTDDGGLGAATSAALPASAASAASPAGPTSR